MYTQQEQQEIYRAVYEYAADQLLWRILYLDCVASHTPGTAEIREKLLTLPGTLSLILRSVCRSDDLEQLIQCIDKGNRIYVEYVDNVFLNGGCPENLRRMWDKNTAATAQALAKVDPEWTEKTWTAMMLHQNDLLEHTCSGVKKGNYDILVDVLPFIRRLATDMSEYLAKGLCA